MDVGVGPHAHQVGGRPHASARLVELGHAVDVVVVAGAAPARAGDVAAGVDVAVAGGAADEFVPGADADQGAVGLLQQAPRLSHVEQVFGMGGHGGAEIGRRRPPARSALRQRQPGALPGVEAAVEQAHVGHAGVQHQVRRARRRQRIAPVQHHADVVADAQAQQQLLERAVRHLVPQRAVFQRARVEVAGAGNVAAPEGIDGAESHLEQAPWAARRRHQRRAGGQPGDPRGRDELAPAVQVAAKSGSDDGGGAVQAGLKMKSGDRGIIPGRGDLPCCPGVNYRTDPERGPGHAEASPFDQSSP